MNILSWNFDQSKQYDVLDNSEKLALTSLNALLSLPLLSTHVRLSIIINCYVNCKCLCKCVNRKKVFNNIYVQIYENNQNIINKEYNIKLSSIPESVSY